MHIMEGTRREPSRVIGKTLPVGIQDDGAFNGSFAHVARNPTAAQQR